MAIVLNNKQSTYGSPYAFYTLSMTYSDRTSTSVKVSYTLTANLQYSESWISTGYGLTATIYAGNSSTTKVLKTTGETWSGTGTHTVTGSFTVTGLTSTQTSITTALKIAAVNDFGDNSTSLNKTSGTSLTIPTYSAPAIEPTLARPLADTTGVAIAYIFANGSWVVAPSTVALLSSDGKILYASDGYALTGLEG